MTNAEELKSSGLKATLPRIKILEVFQQTSQRRVRSSPPFPTSDREGAQEPEPQ